jgi:predicted CoA-binding protein
MPDWRDHLITTREQVKALIDRTHRIAVLGIKTPETGEPAYFVPAYVQRAGFEIVPVPVYFPDVTEILGQKIYRRLVDIPGDIDMVEIFRRSHKIPEHVDDILAKRPKAVWMQLGIRNDEVAERLAKEGIDVVQDMCLMVDLQSFGR